MYKNRERIISFESELDTIQKNILELNHRTDMNLKGRMIEELEQIPNVIENIALIPVVDGQLKALEKRINRIDERLAMIDRRFISTRTEIDALTTNLSEQSD